MAEEIGANAPGRLNYHQRKASISNTLSKLTPKPFTRRRTAPDFFTTSSSSSSSYTKIEPQRKHQQPQPQPQPPQSTSSRISRSASLFSGINSLVPRLPIPQNYQDSDLTAPKSVRPPRKINHRYSQPPFFNFNAPQEDATEPLIPKKKPSTQITHRALMQPFSNPPLPRRSTMGNMTRNPSTQIPSFMRPTSSSAARRNSGPVVLKNRAPTTTATPNKLRSRPNGRNPSTMNFSLPSSSRLQKETIQGSPAPIISPKVSFEQSGPSERPKLTTNSNLSFEELLRTLTPEDEIAEEEAEKVNEKPAAIEETIDDPPPTEGPSDEPPAVEETSDAQEAIYVSNPFEITTAQPNGYWAGRVSVLSDRFRSEALESPDSSMHDDSHRLRRVFAHLRGQCATQEAIASLEAFQRSWESKDGGVAAPRGSSGKKVKEKRGVFEILTGRKK